jgi:addiction module HigA family antidote
VASDEQTRTAPRTAAGHALVKRLWPDAALWADIKKVELTRAILAIEAEAAASREVPPEPPRASVPSPGESAGFDRLVDDLRAEFDQGHFIPWDEVIAHILAAPSPEPVAAPPALREAAQAVIEWHDLWIEQQSDANLDAMCDRIDGQLRAALRAEPGASAHRAVCANDSEPWPCHHITRLTEAGALPAEPGADVVAARDWSVPPSEVLREWLQERGLTQVEVARRMGVAPPEMSKLVNGHDRITPRQALALERACGINADVLARMQTDYDLHRLCAALLVIAESERDAQERLERRR